MAVLPRDHTDYTELDTCPCQLCVDYRNAETQFLESAKVIDSGEHPFRCNCEICKNHRKLNKAQLIADAKRTLWSESVFTAEGHSWGPIFLEYMENRILSGVDTDYFWIQDIESISMDILLEEWIDAVGESEILLSASRIHMDDASVNRALGIDEEKRSDSFNIKNPHG